MPTIVLSLGIVVNTNDKNAIDAFQTLANTNCGGTNVLTLLPRLHPLFRQFNLNEISEEDFIKRFLEILPIPVERFREAWNAMCTLDETTNQTIQAMVEYQRQGIKFYIYSDTNPIHYKYLQEQLVQRKLILEEANTFISYLHKLSKESLVQKTVTEAMKKSADDNCILLLGNPGFIANSGLKDAAEQQVKKICASLASVPRLRIEIIPERSLTSQTLQRMVAVPAVTPLKQAQEAKNTKERHASAAVTTVVSHGVAGVNPHN